MFEWLTKIFKKSTPDQSPPADAVPLPPASVPADPTPAASAPNAASASQQNPTPHPLPRPIPAAQVPRPQSDDPTEPHRPEKICGKCGAPNDTFVDVCWMCKERC